MFLFADNLGVGDLFAAVNGYIYGPYDVEGIGTFDALACVGRVFAEALAEAAELFAVGGIPCWP